MYASASELGIWVSLVVLLFAVCVRVGGIVVKQLGQYAYRQYYLLCP